MVRMGKSRKVDLGSGSGLEVYISVHPVMPIFENILEAFWSHDGVCG